MRHFPEADLTRDLDAALAGADCAAIGTKHRQYYDLDLSRVKDLMRTPIIVDGRNVIDRKKAEQTGYFYQGIGKGK